MTCGSGSLISIEMVPVLAERGAPGPDGGGNGTWSLLARFVDFVGFVEVVTYRGHGTVLGLWRRRVHGAVFSAGQAFSLTGVALRSLTSRCQNFDSAIAMAGH